MVDYTEITIPLPCPFCGGKAEVNDLGDFGFFVKCSECEVNQDKVYKQRCDAIKAWNRRKSPPIERDKIRITEGEYETFNRAMLIAMYLKDLLRMVEEIDNV